MSKPITPADIRDHTRASGYRYVGSAAPGGRRDGKFWRAQVGTGNTHGSKDSTRPSRWKGPTRQDALQAAWDYCNHINNGAAPATPALKSAGHPVRTPSIDRDVREGQLIVALKRLREERGGRQGFVYLIGIEGDTRAMKIGYSVEPEARVGELQAGSYRKLVLLAKKEGTRADELDLHQRYIDDNILGEWFRPTRPLLSEFNLSVAVLGVGHMELRRSA